MRRLSLCSKGRSVVTVKSLKEEIRDKVGVVYWLYLVCNVDTWRLWFKCGFLSYDYCHSLSLFCSSQATFPISQAPSLQFPIHPSDVFGLFVLSTLPHLSTHLLPPSFISSVVAWHSPPTPSPVSHSLISLSVHILSLFLLFLSRPSKLLFCSLALCLLLLGFWYSAPLPSPASMSIYLQ